MCLSFFFWIKGVNCLWSTHAGNLWRRSAQYVTLRFPEEYGRKCHLSLLLFLVPSTTPKCLKNHCKIRGFYCNCEHPFALVSLAGKWRTLCTLNSTVPHSVPHSLVCTAGFNHWQWEASNLQFLSHPFCFSQNLSVHWLLSKFLLHFTAPNIRGEVNFYVRSILRKKEFWYVKINFSNYLGARFSSTLCSGGWNRRNSGPACVVRPYQNQHKYRTN